MRFRNEVKAALHNAAGRSCIERVVGGGVHRGVAAGLEGRLHGVDAAEAVPRAEVIIRGDVADQDIAGGPSSAEAGDLAEGVNVVV